MRINKLARQKEVIPDTREQKGELELMVPCRYYWTLRGKVGIVEWVGCGLWCQEDRRGWVTEELGCPVKEL